MKTIKLHFKSWLKPFSFRANLLYTFQDETPCRYMFFQNSFLLKNVQPCLHQCITHYTVVWWLSVEKEMSCNFALEKCHFFGTLLLWAIKFLHTQGSNLMCWQKWLALPPLCTTPISGSQLLNLLWSLSTFCCIQIEWLFWKTIINMQKWSSIQTHNSGISKKSDKKLIYYSGISI